MNGSPRSARSAHVLHVAALRKAYASSGAAFAMIDAESPTDATLQAFDAARERVEAAHLAADYYLLGLLAGEQLEASGEVGA